MVTVTYTCDRCGNGVMALPGKVERHHCGGMLVEQEGPVRGMRTSDDPFRPVYPRRWEYRVMVVAHISGLSGCLDQSGKEGWELVALQERPALTYLCVFKRPIDG